MVEEKVSFLKSFTHILNTSSKSKASIGSLSAYLVSQGSGIGKKQMAESSDISIDDLNGVERKFIRIKTLDKACNEIINEIAKLRIFKDYNLSDYGIHASLDGQKIETRYQTIMARYSKKYFGTKKGVVSYSLIANHLPVVTKIISANEHESHYVLDLVYNNKSDLDIKAISGDMHSINRVNFFFLRMFNYDFMPRFTKFNIRAENNLVGFKKLSSYSKYLIKPIKKIKIDNIIKEWDNVLRILASLALKETTQSVIISKLSSCRKINTTLKALIEFNNIIMSVYMLKYIDDSKIRQSVYRALNRGESFHQIRSAILKISGRKSQGKKDLELEVSNQCNRLLACCIIYYNTAILSELLEIAEQLGNKKLCKGIKRLSPVAWQHINMIGKFEFFVKKESLNIGEIANDLMENSEDILVAA
ncbi:Tn3 family transposase [Rickettsiales endosymbiont of Trichoplax sp. H2]|uniref:Tn3 family transposase n=1 Tax=Rickettsiales endosymbiont of Trichoplax sp. H2 TaxID=2021221 RepID=UPI0012B41898|nr:Tn3 family transposase [Rickettsiales endosymbiont of Trichoplax sp. H2]MSO14550.1 Transposase for transposon Tn3 [Rickettsiales endosymbiont of Trichoplax sp. H2]